MDLFGCKKKDDERGDGFFSNAPSFFFFLHKIICNLL